MTIDQSISSRFVKVIATSALVGGLICFLSIPAHAAKKPKVTGVNWADSFLDVDNDGRLSDGDILLKDLPNNDDLTFSYTQPLGSYVPPERPSDHPVGLVLQGALTLGVKANTSPTFTVNGNITMRGSITVKKPDTGLDFETVSGDIVIEKGAKIRGNGDVDFTARSGSITVGDKAEFYTTGSFAVLTLKTMDDGRITIGDNVKASTSGEYCDVIFSSAKQLIVGEGFNFKGSNHSGVELRGDGDLALSKAELKSGYIVIDAGTLRGAARTITLKNTKIQQTYANGSLEIVANGPLPIGHGTIELIGSTTITYKPYAAFFLPDIPL